jgi:hypothetical protein
MHDPRGSLKIWKRESGALRCSGVKFCEI